MDDYLERYSALFNYLLNLGVTATATELHDIETLCLVQAAGKERALIVRDVLEEVDKVKGTVDLFLCLDIRGGETQQELRMQMFKIVAAGIGAIEEIDKEAKHEKNN